MVDHLYARGEHGLLDAVCDKRQSLLQLYSDFRTDSRLAGAKADLDAVDLEPYVARWHATLVRRKVKSADDYLVQLRRFMPEGVPFPRADFTRVRVRDFLDGLPVSNATRNRHRAALSVFAGWLIEADVLDVNPAAIVKRAKESNRTTFYTEGEAKQLIGALEGESKVLEAIMAGTGMEWSAVIALKRRDIDLGARTLHAHGSKTEWRDRVVAVTEKWCWPIIERHAKALLPTAPLFTITQKAALKAHRDAVKALKLAPTTLHDWRHTYAVALRRRGVPDHLIARQLGHSPRSLLVALRYGAYTPSTNEIARAAAGK